jgi:hypothetical protein
MKRMNPKNTCCVVIFFKLGENRCYWMVQTTQNELISFQESSKTIIEKILFGFQKVL